MTLLEARRKAAAQGIALQDCKEYPLRFKDGTTIYQDPAKMQSVQGFPIVNPVEYLQKYHPERLKEYLDTHRAVQEERIKNIDAILYGIPS